MTAPVLSWALDWSDACIVLISADFTSWLDPPHVFPLGSSSSGTNSTAGGHGMVGYQFLPVSLAQTRTQGWMNEWINQSINQSINQLFESSILYKKIWQWNCSYIKNVGKKTTTQRFRRLQVPLNAHQKKGTRCTALWQTSPSKTDSSSSSSSSSQRGRKLEASGCQVYKHTREVYI